MIVALIAFIGAIAYMQIGGSENNPYEMADRPVELKENPKIFEDEFIDPRTQNETESYNGTIFEDLPRFDPPPDLIERLPKGFACTQCKGLPDIQKSNETENEVIEEYDNTLLDRWDELDQDYFDKEDTKLQQNQTKEDIDIARQKLDIYNQESGSSKTQKNVTLRERNDKARNLPNVEFVDLSFFNFDVFNIFKLRNIIGFNSVIFLLLLTMPIVILNKIVPNWVTRLDEFDDVRSYNDTLFVMPKRNLGALKRRQERVKRLLVFNDHIGELIERSKIRIERKTPSHTIIIGYHELDKAFSKFSSLIRTKDVTPLEHSQQHFETGEIDNAALEKIVNLFYFTRFASSEINKQKGYDFIDQLNALVLDKTKISEKLELMEQEINAELNNLNAY